MRVTQRLRVTEELRVIPELRVTRKLRVTEKTPSKINKKIKALFLYYRTDYTCPPYREKVEFGQSHKNISMSKTTENYRYTVGRLLSRYWISIGESDKELSDVRENQY